jgi:large subunit ribosomal protein L2
MSKSNLVTFLKKFKIIKKSTGGRSNSGKIVTRHRGAGIRRFYIAYNRSRLAVMYSEFVVVRFIYDALRDSKLALIANNQGVCQLILAPEGVQLGSLLYYSNTFFSRDMSFAPGTNGPLYNLPTGSRIYNVENKPGQGGVYARAAGCYAKLLIKKQLEGQRLAGIQLPSKKIIYVLSTCHAFLGRVSNFRHKFKILGKAGTKRNFGIRPTVRGVAMNPIDHPHGGGEGKKATPALPRTPWGKPAKWKKTTNKIKRQKYNIFISRINNLATSVLTKKIIK